MCLDGLWTTLLWKSHVVGKQCARTKKFVVVFKGLLTSFHLHANFIEDKPILLDEIHHHWHKLRMGEESNDHGFCVDEEWNGIQERLKNVPYEMKLEIKEVLW